MQYALENISSFRGWMQDASVKLSRFPRQFVANFWSWQLRMHTALENLSSFWGWMQDASEKLSRFR